MKKVSFWMGVFVFFAFTTFVFAEPTTCVFHSQDDDGGTLVIEATGDDTSQLHTETTKATFNNYHAGYYAGMDVYWNYVLTGTFTEEETVEGERINFSKITGNGQINIEGLDYQINVNVNWDRTRNIEWGGWIEINGQRLEVNDDNELGDTIESIVVSNGIPSPHYVTSWECSKNGRVSLNAESDSFEDITYCKPAVSLLSSENCKFSDMVTYEYHDLEYDTKYLNLGRVKLNGRVTIEKKTEEVEDDFYIFPVISKLQGSLDVFVYGQNHHVDLDFYIVGNLKTLADRVRITSIHPVNFLTERNNLKIDGISIPQNEQYKLMNIIIPLIYRDTEPINYSDDDHFNFN